jgi:hypothetical protein
VTNVSLWPLIKHARPLPNGQPDTWPMLDRRGKDLPQELRVRKQRLVGLFVGPIAHDGT